MLIVNFIIVERKIVFRAPDDPEVRRCLLAEPDWDLHLLELGVVLRVLHLFHDDALLHLSYVLLLDNSEKPFERVIYLVRIVLVAVSDGLAQEIEPSLLGQS